MKLATDETTKETFKIGIYMRVRFQPDDFTANVLWLTLFAFTFVRTCVHVTFQLKRKVWTSLETSGSKFWLKVFYDNGGSAEKIAKPPVKRRKITAVTGVSWKNNSDYSRFLENFRRSITTHIFEK